MKLFSLGCRFDSSDADQFVFASESLETAKKEAKQWVDKYNQWHRFTRVAIREYTPQSLLSEDPSLGDIEHVIYDMFGVEESSTIYADDTDGNTLDNAPALIAEGVL